MYLVVHDLVSTTNISGIMYNVKDGTRQGTNNNSSSIQQRYKRPGKVLLLLTK